MTQPKQGGGHIVLRLTKTEASYLSEAVRYSQEQRYEDSGKLDPVLSRVQRKLGEEPNA